ncbi:MAG: GWxTD domain-containing protein [Bacteroidales bacterium]|nr:GWxTD domain-containing protein [Bacteroidales bacterium]
MKNILTFCLVCFLATQINAQDKNIDAFISYGTFNIIGESNSPYIETYITFDCNSLVYVKNQNEYEASINLTVLFKQGESIKNYDKYSVTSPKVADTSNVNGFFMDVQRYSLANGEYQMEITIEDANNTNKPLQVSETIVVDYPETICFSSIIALEDYKPSEEASTNSKNGYDIVPMIMPYYPESINRLTFYAEIYNTKKILGENEKYLLNTYLKTFESNTIVNNYFFTKRMNVKDTEVVINTMDISNLPSGNYYLVLEVRDRNNEVIGYNQFFFQRSNSNYEIDNAILATIDPEKVFSGNIDNIDTIREYIRTLEAISSQIEKEYAFNLVKTDDIKTMQQYFYSFWASRNALSPQIEWENYYAQVKRVNASFTAQRMKGYQTDRGIVFLKYGAPDRIVQNHNEPGAYPYEIWHYYTLQNQRNKKFVFMTKDIVTNDFQLIHSDAIGELNNNRWTNEIYSRTYSSYYDYYYKNGDGSVSPNTYGDDAEDYYDNPR